MVVDECARFIDFIEKVPELVNTGIKLEVSEVVDCEIKEEATELSDTHFKTEASLIEDSLEAIGM